MCTPPEAGITRVFQMLGKRWTGLIIAALMNGPGHFAELRRSVPGISERMLSDRLSELAVLNLVEREVEPGPPLRVSYRLTQGGHALRPAMTELTRWADAHLPEESEACPSEFRDGARPSGG
ncbi:helix-turn-helix domain-containing protein [Streptomyces sp. JJ36]|uniref:winged helix-turn-helix transcriptional regulator n=1 Tax=Streptomyces sp. JJ36 TaxID=2736645 RepID=UPI001F20D6E2|nr:helix-turn-helix domain-containing protein [Streptomyces sp. JJ36]MCF6524870.1 helix-turn-helix transcriptional regulator [Streptomyces sp. JJ36]